MELILLAISIKEGKLCVAGIDYKTHKYVRVGHCSKNICGPIDPSELKINDHQCKIMDVIEVDVSKADQLGCQLENYNLISINKYIKTINVDELSQIYTSLNHSSYVFKNSNRYLVMKELEYLNQSLELFCVDNLTLKYEFLKYEPNKKKLFAYFRFNGREYKHFSVTDSSFCGYPAPYGPRYSGSGFFKKAYLMVSVPYGVWSFENKKFWKYISGIIIS